MKPPPKRYFHSGIYSEAVPPPYSYNELARMKPPAASLYAAAMNEITYAEHYDTKQVRLINAIIGKYGNKVYFSPLNINNNSYSKEQPYNEGLLLKYSAKAYHNMAVKRRRASTSPTCRNTCPCPSATTGPRASVSRPTMPCCRPTCCPYYDWRHYQHYHWLIRLFVSRVTNTSLNEEHKTAVSQPATPDK